MQFIMIDERQVAEVLTYSDLIPLMANVLIEFSSGAAIQPVRQMLQVEEHQRYLGVMPAVMSSAMGAKLVCFYPKDAGTAFPTHLASILLFDPQNGQPLAVLDGRLITEMRTAAVSSAVARRLAASDSRAIAFIGSGVQAEAHLEALRTCFPLDDIRVWSRTRVNADKFAERFAAQSFDSVEDAVHGADIIVCATNSREAVLKGEWLKPGAHVISVGSPRPDWRELDDAVMSNVVVVDSREAAMKEAGDVILSGATIHGEAGQVLSGDLPVPPGSITVFKSVGIAVEDLAAARHVYEKHLALTS